MITQMLYAVVFCTRYLDLFGEEQYLWNLFFKIFYIASSIYIVAVMKWVYPRTREKEISWKIGAVALAGSALATPFAYWLLESGRSVHQVGSFLPVNVRFY